MIARILLRMAIVVTAAWAGLALWVQRPLASVGTLSLIFLTALLAIAALVCVRPRPRTALALYAIGTLSICVWWWTIVPTNNRDWAPDVAQQTQGAVAGDRVTLTNVRNFDWKSDTDFTQRWETRHYDLTKLQSTDMIVSYWGMPAIAHTLVSFGFEGGEQIVFSVEIRRERHESFSELGGFFKQFELSVVAADERDIVRVRTNVRDEDDYLFRVNMSPEARRSLFLAYVEQANALPATPRFYNTVTANCTTIIYHMAKRIVDGLPWDYRLLASGYLPEYLFDLGAFSGASTIEEYRARGRITDRARATTPSDDFSKAIRQGVPGIPAGG